MCELKATQLKAPLENDSTDVTHNITPHLEKSMSCKPLHHHQANTRNCSLFQPICHTLDTLSMRMDGTPDTFGIDHTSFWFHGLSGSWNEEEHQLQSSPGLTAHLQAAILCHS
jgi:hypothetical protein